MQPITQPTAKQAEFGGLREYFAVAQAEIHSAAYSADIMGYQIPVTTDLTTW